MDPTSEVSSTFLFQLVGGRVFQIENVQLFSIENPSVLKVLFTHIIGVLDETQQDATLDALISLVKPCCANVEVCTRVGFHMDILAFLREKALYRDGFITNNVLKKTLRLLMYIFNHSVTVADVRAMLSVFQSPRMVHDPPDDNAMSLYLSTLEVIARDAMGPCAFFDLSGEYSGLLLPSLEVFPSQGYTFCVWIKFERLAQERSPLFTFCGRTGAGVMAWFQQASLFLMSTDKKKTEMQIEIQDLMIEGKWQFLTIAHTHRQLRSSKVDVYVNGELKQSVKLSYPNVANVAPLLRPLLCLGDVDDHGKPSRSLRALCGPMALFGQALPANAIQTLRTTDDYDALILQFNAYISSATISGNAGSSELSKNVAIPTGSQDGLIFSYDTRNCDQNRGICFDSSGNGRHAEVSGAGVRLRIVDKFKRVVAELGGPLICLPLLVTTPLLSATTDAEATSTNQLGSSTAFSKSLDALRSSTIQFAEDKEFLQHIGGLVARPLGVRSIPRVIALLAEIMRHSPINKFCFRRYQGVIVTALLLRTLPAQYLTTELFASVERLRNAVLSDRTLSEDICKSLMFNFRIWVNGSIELQDTVFDKLELMTRKDPNISSAPSTRHFLRCLSWIYWREPNPTSLSRYRKYSTPEIVHLRKRLLDILKIVICESQQAKSSSVISLGLKSKEAKPQVSYESTRALIFCMIGKPSNSNLSIGGGPSTDSASETSSSNPSSSSQAANETDDPESVVESVPEADLPDLLQLLIELSVQESAPAGLLDLFNRLGGLRTWLPLLSFSSNVIRVMTLRLLRRYLYLQCSCSTSRERTSLNMESSVSLSLADAHLIIEAMNAPASMGVYSELLLLLLGIDVSEHEASVQPTNDDRDCWIDEKLLSDATIWHINLLLPVLKMAKASSMSVRLIAVQHMSILFGSNSTQSAYNRRLLFMTELVADDYAPFVENFVQLRGQPTGSQECGQDQSSTTPTLCGVALTPLADSDLNQLRQLAFGPDQTEENRFKAIYSLVKRDDVAFLLKILADGMSPVPVTSGETKVWEQPYMTGRVKLALVELVSQHQLQATGNFVTSSIYDALTNMTCLEVTSNDAAWFFVRGPFGSYSDLSTDPQELEMLVTTFMKRFLVRLNDIVADQVVAASRNQDVMHDPSDAIARSTLWRNVESICTIASSIVLHYHPDTLDSSTKTTQDLWKCERRLAGETELVDLLWSIWQHLIPYFNTELHGSFGRTTKAQPYDADFGPSGSRTQSLRSSIDEARDRLSTGSLTTGSGPRAAAFPGFKILSSSSGGTAAATSVSQMRPHPGGPMRQALQILLRSFHLILLEAKSANAASDCQARFMTIISRLEYFLQTMKLGSRNSSQAMDSSLSGSSDGSVANSGGGKSGSTRFVKTSSKIKASPGNESSVVLWFVPELAELINHVRFMHWADAAFKLAAVLSSLITIPIRSFEELEKFLDDSDFKSNNQEVQRRDTFFHEQMVHSKERRTIRRISSTDSEQEEKQRAHAELDRICQSTRAQARMGNLTERASQDSNTIEQVWLQRIRARDVDDWIRLRLFLKWGIRHLWGTSYSSSGYLDHKDEFWRLDSYTSSNWIRCRMIPDTDDTKSDDLRNNASPTTMEHSETVANSLPLQLSITSPVQQDDTNDPMEENDEEQDVIEPGATLQSDLMIADQMDHGGDFALQGFHVEDGEKQQEVNYMEVDISTQRTNIASQPDPTTMNGNDEPATEDLPLAIKPTNDKSSGRSRLGNISSRFSTGLLRLRNKSNKNQPSRAADMQSSTEGSEPTSNSVAPVSSSGTSEAKPTASAPASAPAAASHSHTMSRVLRKPEPWKSFSGTYRTKAYLVLPSGVIVYGALRIGVSTIVFEGEQVTTLQAIADGKDANNLAEAQVSQLRRRAWGIRVIRVIHRRRFLLNILNGIEVYFVDGSSCLFGLEKSNEADMVYAFLRERKPPCLAKWGKRLLTTERMFAKNKWTEMWVKREISNFEYLMLLNVSAGRSYNDITQYPVFPWVLRDYESDHIDLTDAKYFRDFRKPIGAQTPETLRNAQAMFDALEASQNSNSSSKPAVPPHHFTIPYSNMNAVLYFLLRLAPFTAAAFEMNGVSKSDPSQEPADAWFDSIQDAFTRCISESDRFYELTPEFFCCADFLVGKSNQFFSRDLDQMCCRPPQKKVLLPIWANSPHDFIRQHRLALESDYVSANLHHWIDLVFGFRQRGPPAVEAKNEFHAACYPDQLDLNLMKPSIRAKLTQRGVIPVQLFQKAHPSRLTHDEAMAARFPSSHEMALLSSRRQVRRHDLNSRHKDAIINIRFSNAFSNSALGIGGGPSLGSGTGIGAHASSDQTSVVYTSDKMGVVLAKKFINHTPDPSRGCPLSLIDIEQWWKLPEGCLVSQGMVFYEQMISCGYWDGSWRIHWSSDGELIQRIAFHKKKILCMACSEDDFTGDLALAFGGEDCTISVWALSKLAASRSRRMFVKKELPVGNLPWVLLFGHTNPVVAVALHVDMDVVVSCSTQNSVMIHSLRSAIPLHTIDIDPQIKSVITQLCISQHGDILIHAIAEDTTSQPPAREDPGLLGVDFGSTHTTTQISVRRSDLYRASMNGDLVGFCRLQDENGAPLLLLNTGVLFTRSGEYIITARAGPESAIEVRDVSNMGMVVRRIECKRAAELTSFGVSQDERCVICGYDDGSVVAYALHFGVCDLGASQQQLDKRARQEEAEALARANKRDILMKETANTKRTEQLYKRASSIGEQQNTSTLWIASKFGRNCMPTDPYLSSMQHCFVLLKRPCVSGDALYEEAREELWYAVYGSNQKPPTSALTTDTLIDFSFGGPDTPNKQPARDPQFERAGETWSRLGFQRPDPTTDFRAGGMLSLQCLLYFAKHLKRDLLRMVNNQIPGSRENTYPWGPAGINITCMTASLFWKSDGELQSDRSMNWPLFVSHEAFYTVFCDAFLLFDRLWTELNAEYGTFSVVIQETTKRVVEVLDVCQGELTLFRSEMRGRFLEKPMESRELRTPPLNPLGEPRSREGSYDLTSLATAISGHEVIDLLTSLAPKTMPLALSVTTTSAAAASDLTAAAVDRATQLIDFITFSPPNSSTSAPAQPQAEESATTMALQPPAATNEPPPVLNEFQTCTTTSSLASDPFAHNDFMLLPPAAPAVTGAPMGLPTQQSQQSQQPSKPEEDPFACLL